MANRLTLPCAQGVVEYMYVDVCQAHAELIFVTSYLHGSHLLHGEVWPQAINSGAPGCG